MHNNRREEVRAIDHLAGIAALITATGYTAHKIFEIFRDWPRKGNGKRKAK